jgi:hypothetical protein
VDADRRVVGVVRRFDVVGEYLKRVHAPADHTAPMSPPVDGI